MLNFLDKVEKIWYIENGTKLVSYTYDAWGNVTTTYHNGGASTAAQYNPFRYRGYYYDSELGFYYLNSRYYDPETGRFISADNLMSGVNGSLHGSNLFVYCFNDPINLTDSVGNWPEWVEKAAAWTKENIVKPAVDAVVNYVDAVYKSIEVQVGVGLGIGASVDDYSGITFYHDVYVGVDDGVITTGHEVGNKTNTYNHWSEKGNESYKCYDCLFSDNFNAYTIINCQHTKKVNDKFNFGVFKLNSENDLVISLDVDAHVGGGGHVKLGFNWSEFLRRLSD